MGIQREQQRALSLRMARHEMLQSGLELDFPVSAAAPAQEGAVTPELPVVSQPLVPPKTGE